MLHSHTHIPANNFVILETKILLHLAAFSKQTQLSSFFVMTLSLVTIGHFRVAHTPKELSTS